jgi:phosphoglycerol transferase MdoB-like AlkP superfamily enzyme
MMTVFTTVICILADLSHTIKNEWLGLIATVLLSAFVSEKAEDPDAPPPPTIQIVVVPIGAIVMLGLHNPPRT